jgi:thiamine biosynthesis lipoprotein
VSVTLGASSWRALGTSARVLVADAAACDEARAAVERDLDAVDLACSRFRDDSELAAVNAARGRPVRVSPLLLDALEVALRAARLTDGLVDPTVGRAVALSGYDRDFPRVRGSRIRRAHAGRIAGWEAVELDVPAGSVRVPEGVSLDLGATAKAFAADRAARLALAATDASGVLVNLGGDIAVAGIPPDGGWSIRVADSHLAGEHEPGQTVTITSGGLCTSSTTVRRWRRRGEEAHHIIDPRTGGPAAVYWRTVSVAAATCVDANIASTAAIVLGDRAVPWLAERGLPARLVSATGNLGVIAGWPVSSPEAT